MAVKSYIDNASGEQAPRNRTKEEVKIPIGEYELVLMSLVFLTSNQNASFRLKQKVFDFVSRLDPELYVDNQDVSWRIALTRSLGTAVMKNGARALPAIESRVYEDTDWADFHGSFFEAYRENLGHPAGGVVIENELSDEDIQFIDNFVSTRLRYIHLWGSRNILREIADRIDAEDMGDISEFNDNVAAVLERLVSRMRNSKTLLTQESMDFTTGDNSFTEAIRATVEARSKPQSVVRTGVAMFNEMIGGGYEGSRVYVHFGRSGDWKSGWLCSVAFWACDARFNPHYLTKDPTRKPAVLFLTMENDLFDTIERMTSFHLGSDFELRNADPETVIRALEEAFSSDTCNFIFKFRPSRSISTADIDGMIEEEYIRGNEVVLVVQDYIKRIKSVDTVGKDARHLELGSIVDEFSAIAKRRNIPVVTGMQMNRGAYEKLNSAVEKNDLEAIKKLGATDVGESINVYENADVVIFQSRVPIESNNSLWLSQRRAKFRGRRISQLDFINQPFDRDSNGDINEMRLCEDAHFPNRRDWFGTKNISDTIAKEYDPDAAMTSINDENIHGQDRNERRQSRSGSLVKKKQQNPLPVSDNSHSVAPKLIRPAKATMTEIPDKPKASYEIPGSETDFDGL